METDERLLPVPSVKESKEPQTLQPANQEYPSSYSPFNDQESFDDKRSVYEYINVVYKRLPYILALTILTTAAAAFYMYRQPSIFQAQTILIVEPRKPKVQNTQAVNINFGNDQTYYNTQLKLLQNPELMQDVVVRLGLHNNPTLLANRRRGVFETFSSMFSGGDKPPAEAKVLPVISSENAEESMRNEQASLTKEERETVEAFATYLVRGLTVDQTPRTNLVNLSIKNENPALAAKVSDAVATVFIEKDSKRETSGAENAYKELSKSIDDLKVTIAGQEQSFISQMKGKGLVALGDGKVNDLSKEELSVLGKQRLDAIDERRQTEARYNSAIRSNNPYGSLDNNGNSAAEILRSQNEARKAKVDDELRVMDKQIQSAEAELAKLRVKYTEEYQPVREKKAEISKLKSTRDNIERKRRSQISKDKRTSEKDIRGDIINTLKAQLSAARKRESQLDLAYARAVASASNKGIAETKLTTLKREIETNRKLLDTYIQRQKEQELSIESSRPDNIKISANAIVPVNPIGPNRTRNILIAFLVSLVGGIGLSFLLDYLDDSIKSSDDVGRNLGLPTLALIPHFTSNENKKRKLLSVGENSDVQSTALIALENTHSPVSEAYRHLRTSLLFSSAGKPPQTILVTSSQPSEGKTTTAINTAITLAQSGAEVVIIDCDLRRPRLHSHFSLENSHGLTNYLSGEKETDNLLKECPNLPKLKIITSGPIPPNPTELLSSNEMKNLLQLLKGKYKHVVIDSPPAISFTDAAILSTLVDGVVLVAMVGKSSIHLMRRFKQRLGNIGARIYGVVLNGIKSDSVEYGYYNYGYNYSYTASDDDDSTPRMDETKNDDIIDDIIDENDYVEEDIHNTKS